MNSPPLSIGRYRITFQGDIIQEKNLIRHTDYENIIKPIQNEIYTLQLKKDFENAALLKDQLQTAFGTEWFTDKSPLFNTLNTGFLTLPRNQGLVHSCKLELL